MRFYVDPASAPAVWPTGHRAYITSFDGRVHSTRVDFDDRILTFRRQQQESGKLHIPWAIPGRGRPVVSTTSLPEREQPYVLPLELARGKLAEVREQAAVWQQLRMVMPPEYTRSQQTAFQLLARASSSQDDLELTCRLAEESLRNSFDAAELLTREYVAQRRASRPAAGAPRSALLGARLDADLLNLPIADRLPGVFGAVAVPIEWNAIEPDEGNYSWDAVNRVMAYAAEHRLVMRGGPLVDFGPGGLPNWLKTWQNDILNLPSFVCDFVETAVSKYMGMIRLWEVAASGNTGGALALSEDHRLAIVARVLETASRTHSDGQFFIRVDQPWGEYQARGQHRLSPLQFVDALLRSNLGLTGVNLEIAMGYQPAGSLSRDLFSISRLIDLWSQLGVQLHVTLAAPSSMEVDSAGDDDLEVIPSAPAGAWTPAAQEKWLTETASLLIAKPAVTGVFISHLSDAIPHYYPNAGIIAADGTPKPAFASLKAMPR
ncbi:endo-1,4-beta-xylanase [Caulifigura coniformis]|nr:endo-1,4-beta-xylanase [Caulifigura coniformis]